MRMKYDLTVDRASGVLLLARTRRGAGCPRLARIPLRLLRWLWTNTCCPRVRGMRAMTTRSLSNLRRKICYKLLYEMLESVRGKKLENDLELFFQNECSVMHRRPTTQYFGEHLLGSLRDEHCVLDVKMNKNTSKRRKDIRSTSFHSHWPS